MSRKTRKLIWSAPLVAVLAVAGALAIFMTLQPNGVFADALPSAPMNLTAEADGWYEINLDWDAPSTGAPDGYRIDMSGDGFGWETLVADTGNTRTSYSNDTGLQAGTNRHYRVFALNSHGAGRVSNPTSATTDDPEKPKPVTTLRARNNGQDKIELSWTDPTDTGGLDITQYCIRWATDIDMMPDDCIAAAAADAGVFLLSAEEVISPSCYVDPAGDVSMGTYINSGLSPSTTRHYEIVVITRQDDPDVSGDEELASDASDTAVDTTDGAEKPGAPTGLTVVPIISEDFNLYWYSPKENGGAAITGYRVEVREDGARWPDASTTPGRSGDTGTYTYSTTTDPTSGNAVFRTTAPTAVQLLQFTLSTASVPVDTDEEEADTELEIRIFAENGTVADPGIRTSASSSDTVSTEPTTALERPEAPTVIASTGLDGKINVTITPPTAGATAYRIDSSKNGRDWELEVRDTRFTRFANNVYEDINLGPDATRYYRVFVFDENGRDVGIAAMNNVAGTTKASEAPGMVKNLEAEGVSSSQIDLSWDAPDDTGGRPIDKYQIQYADPTSETDRSVDNTTWDNLACQVGSMTEYSDKKGLKVNTKKFYRVVAINSMHPAGDTEQDNFTDEADDALVASATTKAGSPPGMVIGLTAEQASDSSGPTTADTGVVLLWNEPSTAGGDVVEGYIVERTKDGGTTWEEIADEDDTMAVRTDWTDPDHLPEGESRMYRVSAKNSAGTSATSTIGFLGYHVADGHTHNNAPTTVGTIPDTTVMVGYVNTSAMAASSYFSDADGDTLDITASSSDATVATAMVDSNGKIAVTGVAVGSTTVTVTADDGSGGMVSQKFMVTVEAADTTPRAPRGVMASIDATAPDGTDVIVTWTDGANAEAHGVLLFNSDFSLTEHIDRGTGGSHTFENVAAGSYIAVVVVLDAQGGLVTDADGDYLYAGAESTVTVQ